MATVPNTLAQPPDAPPDVQAQGQPSMPPSAVLGGGNPQGQVLAQLDTVKKVLDQVAQQNDQFAPFATRAKAVIDQGIAQVLGGPGAGQGGQQQPPPDNGGGGAAPGFPG